MLKCTIGFITVAEASVTLRLVSIISVIFSGEKEHEAIFLVLLSVIIPLVLAFETIFVANTTELFLWNNKTAGINSSIFGQGHGYALLEVLPLCTAIHKRKD